MSDYFNFNTLPCDLCEIPVNEAQLFSKCINCDRTYMYDSKEIKGKEILKVHHTAMFNFKRVIPLVGKNCRCCYLPDDINIEIIKFNEKKGKNERSI